MVKNCDQRTVACVSVIIVQAMHAMSKPICVQNYKMQMLLLHVVLKQPTDPAHAHA